jgi:hypothetical protein
MPLLICLVIVLAGFVIWSGYRALSPQNLPAARIEPNNPQYSFLQEMARKSQGNIENLSPTERDQVMQMTRGYGERILKDHWAALKP